MKLNKNSWYNKLYNAMWEEYVPQKSLCPYFWKLVICFFTIIPVFINAIPSFIILFISNLFIKDEDNKFRNSEELLKFELIIVNLVINVLILWVCCMILVFFPHILNDKDLLIIGVGGWVVVLVLLGLGLCGFIKKRMQQNKMLKNTKTEKSDSLLKVTGEFIKAKYNKYCPTIEWVGTDTNEELPKTNPINHLYDND